MNHDLPSVSSKPEKYSTSRIDEKDRTVINMREVRPTPPASPETRTFQHDKENLPSPSHPPPPPMSNPSPSFPPHLNNINNPPLNPMPLPLKPTILPPLTLPTALLIIRAAMPINTPQIITLAAKLTRRHAAHIPQRLQLVLRGLVMVIVRARVIRAVVPQEMHVAHLELLDAFDFVGVVGYDWVDALAVAVSGDCREGFGAELRGWWWGGQGWAACHGCCGPRGCGWV